MMVKYHIDNELTRLVQKRLSCVPELSDELQERLYKEIKNATMQGIDSKLVQMSKDEVDLPNNINSLLLFILGICQQAPVGPQKIKNPGSMMDIDLDFSKNKREQVFVYLKEKYGNDKVCQVGTFGTMAAKGAIKNAARALNFDIKTGELASKFIGGAQDATIQDSIKVSKDFQDLIKKNSDVAKIIDVAQKLEGLPNSLGVHASACIISDIAINETIPLMISLKKDGGNIITQFDYKDTESNSLIKFDILGYIFAQVKFRELLEPRVR